jgi:hypothetical protein
MVVARIAHQANIRAQPADEHILVTLLHTAHPEHNHE